MKRRKFLTGLAGVVPVGALMYHLNLEEEITLSHTFNPKLPYEKRPSDWKGTPVRSDGTFQNLHYPFQSSLYSVLKWKLKENPQAEEKKKDTRRLEVEQVSDFNASGKDQLIWLGHASYLIKVAGVTILTDPVWLDNWVLKRFSSLPFDPEQIRDIDYILISHDHRDHCDEATLKLLGQLVPRAKVLTGLKMQSLLKPWLPKNSIQEAGWFQSYDLKDSLRITYVPTRHWSRRGLADTNQRLWGGFFIESTDRSFYFMGDSGYGPHFKMIAETLGSPDLAMMGVGAFKPEWFMHPVHVSPMDAAKAFREMGAKSFVPMHFGTFDLSDELLLEPLDWLKANPEEVNHSLVVPTIGRNLLG
ncbi:MBL fold metallo-hydrolase [Algoriphagus sp. AK58]|uniref:MBL fold metallo-hydrolase n=1 Tax=Algoriphagus sp. AK58 TaxID=1406877 RepID=UPI002107856C|nr:MBL fold metallo-hydrolase [Algoriphagus sp. AK58]